MSNYDMQDEQLMAMVNGAAEPVAECQDPEDEKRAEEARRAEKAEAKKQEMERMLQEEKEAQERQYRKARKHHWMRTIVEVGGWASLGAVMLAAMAAQILPWFVCAPIFTGAWIWCAIRIDRTARIASWWW